MVALAAHDSKSPLPLSRIAADHSLPYKFISQIAIDLKRAGLIKSKEGFGGGYLLQKPSAAISVGDIVHATEGPIAPVSCFRGKVCKHQATCTHKKVLQKLAAQLEATLAKTSLAQLI